MHSYTISCQDVCCWQVMYLQIARGALLIASWCYLSHLFGLCLATTNLEAYCSALCSKLIINNFAFSCYPQLIVSLGIVSLAIITAVQISQV